MDSLKRIMASSHLLLLPKTFHKLMVHFIDNQVIINFTKKISYLKMVIMVIDDTMHNECTKNMK